MPDMGVTKRGIISEAYDVAYTPKTPADWTDPDPQNVGDALDKMATAQGGDVDGPASSAVNEAASFADTSGKLLKASGLEVLTIGGTSTIKPVGSGFGNLILKRRSTGQVYVDTDGTNRVICSIDGTQTLTNKTLTLPIIGDFSNATHTHQNAAGGGTLDAAAITAGTFATARIADDAVTYAKMQNVSATDKVLGRATAGAGDVEEIACTAAGRALIDDADAAAQRTTLDAADKHFAVNTQTGTAYTLVLADDGKYVDMDNAAANTLTVPPNSSVAFPVGTRIAVGQKGAGQTTVAAGAGVTVNSQGSALKMLGQFASAMLMKISTDVWRLSGEIRA